MIRRVLIILFALVVWSVQTIDVGMDYSAQADTPNHSSILLQTPADSSPVGEAAGDDGLSCNGGCVCHVLHHAFFEEPTLLTHVSIDGERFAVLQVTCAASGAVRLFRPPLV